MALRFTSTSFFFFFFTLTCKHVRLSMYVLLWARRDFRHFNQFPVSDHWVIKHRLVIRIIMFSLLRFWCECPFLLPVCSRFKSNQRANCRRCELSVSTNANRPSFTYIPIVSLWKTSTAYVLVCLNTTKILRVTLMRCTFCFLENICRPIVISSWVCL